MIKNLAVLVIATGALSGTADAAPGFGSASHRLGGGATGATAENSERSVGVVEAIFNLLNRKGEASVAAVTPASSAAEAARAKECDKSKKTEVAKAEAKPGETDKAAKGRMPTGEPVYLAF